MKVFLVAINGFSALMLLIALILLIRGIVIIISGKCKLHKELLKGKSARAVGLVFIAAPICAFALWAIMYESFGWGSRGSYYREDAIRSITSASVESVLLIIGIIGAYLWAFSKAKAHKQSENNQQKELKPMPKTT